MFRSWFHFLFTCVWYLPLLLLEPPLCRFPTPSEKQSKNVTKTSRCLSVCLKYSYSAGYNSSLHKWPIGSFTGGGQSPQFMKLHDCVEVKSSIQGFNLYHSTAEEFFSKLLHIWLLQGPCSKNHRSVMADSDLSTGDERSIRYQTVLWRHNLTPRLFYCYVWVSERCMCSH